MNKKEIIAIICVAVGGAFAIIFAINGANTIEQSVEQGYQQQHYVTV
jgi:hypothetical protein